jgi:hypothetical protein
MISEMARLPERLANILLDDNKRENEAIPLMIPEGKRHTYMVSFAGYCRHKGYNEDQISVLLAAANSISFAEPLSDKEVTNIAGGCGKYNSLYEKVTVNLDDVKEGPIESVIVPYISRYDTNILEGEPGAGKSTLLGEVAACITTGKKFCGIKPDVMGDVLFFAIEDNPNTVFKTRARLQKADFKKIDFVDTYLTLDDEGFSYLEEALSRKKYALVIIDTLTASLAGMRMNDAGDMAKLLKRLTDIARSYKTTFLVVRHFRKAGAESAGHIGMGSTAIMGGVRSSMMLKVCPDDENKRYLAHNKSNGLKKGKTLTFSIQDAPNEDTEIGQLVWTGTSELTSDELVSMKKGSETELDRAIKFLQTLLRLAPMEFSKIEAEAIEHGFSDKTLRRAKKEAGIKSKRKGKGWMWSL